MRWATCAAVLLVGCYSGPTYDEALQTYKTELELLNSLERERTAELLPVVREDLELKAEIDKYRKDVDRWSKRLAAGFDKAADEDYAKEQLSIAESRFSDNKRWVSGLEVGRARLAARRKEILDKFAEPIAAQRARVEKALKAKEEAEKHR